MSFEKIDELEQANTELRKKNTEIGDEVGELKAEVNKLSEQNKMLSDRCEKLKNWHKKHSADGANIAASIDDAETADLKKEVETLKTEIEEQKKLALTKTAAAAAARTASADGSETVGAAEHAAAVASLEAEVADLKKKKEATDAQNSALQTQLKTHSSASFAAKLRLLMKEVKDTKAAAQVAKTDVAELVSTVKPMLKDSITEARALKEKVAEGNKELTQKYLKVCPDFLARHFCLFYWVKHFSTHQ